eukprot:4085127-Alexandrium_andersonii.AAC.1
MSCRTGPPLRTSRGRATTGRSTPTPATSPSSARTTLTSTSPRRTPMTSATTALRPDANHSHSKRSH